MGRGQKVPLRPGEVSVVVGVNRSGERRDGVSAWQAHFEAWFVTRFGETAAVRFPELAPTYVAGLHAAEFNAHWRASDRCVVQLGEAAGFTAECVGDNEVEA